MTKLNTAAFWLITMMFRYACSKSAGTQPDPIVPPVDSTQMPDKGDGKDDSGTNPDTDQISPVTKTYEFSRFPVIEASASETFFSGAILSETNTEALLRPKFVPIEDRLRNPVTIYTDLALDVDALIDVMPSMATNRSILGEVKTAFSKGVKQLPSVSFSSALPFESRFNSLRSMIGVNEDMDAYFDLGFADTARLPENKGRIIVSFEVLKANILVQPPIYKPFLTIDSTDQKWLDLFGSEKAPEMISDLIYGENAFLVIESDSSTEKLRKVVDKCLNSPLDKIISGRVFTGLTAEEVGIISSATSYGFSLDGGSFPHTGKEAIIHYAALEKKALDPYKLGRLLYFRLSNIKTFGTFKHTFNVDVYAQKIRK